MINNIFTSIFLLFIGTSGIIAQAVPSSGGSGGSSGSKDSTDKNFSFIPIPYIEYNRSTGFGFGAIPIAMYKINKNDTVSPASISGMVGVYTTNKTWYVILFQKMYFNQDNWRITAAAGIGNYNFQFYIDYPVNDFIDYSTDFAFLYLNVNRRLFSKLYGGIHYTHLSFLTQTELVPDGRQTTQNGLGLIFSFDARDDVYYPINGFLSDADWSSYPEFLENELSSDKIELDHNQYIGMRNDKDVIALRAKVGLGIGDLAFEQQFIVGRNDIRGYTEGKYRGDQLIAIQGEYRWNFLPRISAVGFGGIATVFGSINEDQNGELLPGVGCGFRYNIIEKYHMNVGMDIAVGKEDWGFYFRIGEAF